MNDSRQVVNRATHETVRFVLTAEETGGELLVMENRWTRPEHRTTAHTHPGMEERWLVIEGTVGFQVGDQRVVAGPGETVIAPAGVRHEGWNEGDGPVLLRVEMRPPLRWEQFVRQLFALAGEDLRDEAGARSVTELLSAFAAEVIVDRELTGSNEWGAGGTSTATPDEEGT